MSQRHVQNSSEGGNHQVAKSSRLLVVVVLDVDDVKLILMLLVLDVDDVQLVLMQN